MDNVTNGNTTESIHGGSGLWPPGSVEARDLGGGGN